MPFVMLVLFVFLYVMFLKLDLQVSSINLQGFFRKSPDIQATKVGRSAVKRSLC